MSQTRKKSSSRSKRVTFEEIPRNLASLVRGIYTRVARRLHVDPSYVSRVARSERYSKRVENALRLELTRIVRRVNKQLEDMGENVPEVKLRRKSKPKAGAKAR